MKLTNMPRLIYGTAWKKEKTADFVTQAIECGFRGIDTACQPKHYHEAGVGEALQKLFKKGIARQDLYLQTKFTPINGHDPLNIPYDRKASLSEQVAQSFEVSKKNLGVDYVDCLILHSPLENIKHSMTAWQAMEHIHNQGGTNQIGLSNCYNLTMLKQLYEAALIKPTVLQNRFYQDTKYDHEIRKWCKERNITYQGFWTLTANPHILTSDIVKKTAQAYQKTAEQIFFRVLIDIGIVPLIGTCSNNHMKEDLEILKFDFPRSISEEINSLFLIHC